jgi:putative transposase
MEALDKQYLKMPSYGYRRLTKALQRQGFVVNGKRVRRLMKLMGIEAIYQKPNTSKAHPSHEIYPYLLRDVEVTRPGQVWCTDLTYIPMRKGFLYLTVIMDWYSRYVLAWRLSNTMEAEGCAAALSEALQRFPAPEIHNSDQGSQFTSKEYVGLLLSHQVKVSMDGRGRYFDNIFVERLWRTVKYEEVYLHAYNSPAEARASLAAYFRFYNEERLHQALGYQTPAEVFFANHVNYGFLNGRRSKLTLV